MGDVESRGTCCSLVLVPNGLKLMLKFKLMVKYKLTCMALHMLKFMVKLMALHIYGY